MNISEFDALKVGDRIRNADGAEAEIVSKADWGCQIQWNMAGPRFMLYRQGTLWFGLEVVPAEGQGDEVFTI